MTKKQPSIQIVKVPLEEHEKSNYSIPQQFPRMPRLYLELIENKNKIKQDLINVEHVCKENYSGDEPQEQDIENIVDIDHKSEKTTSKNKDKYSDDDKLKNTNDEYDDIEEKSKHDEYEEEKYSNKRYNETKNYSDDEYDGYKNKYSQRSGSEGDDEHIESPKDLEDNMSIKENNDDDVLSNRLEELLRDTDSESSREKSRSIPRVDKYSKNRGEFKKFKNDYNDFKEQRYNEEQPNNNTTNKISPPTLAELESQGQYVNKQELRNINHVSMSEYEQEDAKRELIFKFELLKKSYKDCTIPEYSLHTDYNTMKKSYESTVRRLSLDSSVDNYKQFLIGGFMLVEFIFGNWLKFDMQGFTQQQILSMNSYEKLLIELGEKSYVPTGSKWPVELRLLFLVIMNAAFFIVSRMILRKTGANIMNMVNSMSSTQSLPKKKKKMSGPSVNFDDLPDT